MTTRSFPLLLSIAASLLIPSYAPAFRHEKQTFVNTVQVRPESHEILKKLDKTLSLFPSNTKKWLAHFEKHAARHHNILDFIIKLSKTAADSYPFISLIEALEPSLLSLYQQFESTQEYRSFPSHTHPYLKVRSLQNILRVIFEEPAFPLLKKSVIQAFTKGSKATRWLPFVRWMENEIKSMKNFEPSVYFFYETLLKMLKPFEEYHLSSPQELENIQELLQGQVQKMLPDFYENAATLKAVGTSLSRVQGEEFEKHALTESAKDAAAKFVLIVDNLVEAYYHLHRLYKPPLPFQVHISEQLQKIFIREKKLIENSINSHENIRTELLLTAFSTHTALQTFSNPSGQSTSGFKKLLFFIDKAGDIRTRKAAYEAAELYLSFITASLYHHDVPVSIKLYSDRLYQAQNSLKRLLQTIPQTVPQKDAQRVKDKTDLKALFPSQNTTSLWQKFNVPFGTQ